MKQTVGSAKSLVPIKEKQTGVLARVEAVKLRLLLWEPLGVAPQRTVPRG